MEEAPVDQDKIDKFQKFIDLYTRQLESNGQELEEIGANYEEAKNEKQMRADQAKNEAAR